MQKRLVILAAALAVVGGKALSRPLGGQGGGEKSPPPRTRSNVAFIEPAPKRNVAFIDTEVIEEKPALLAAADDYGMEDYYDYSKPIIPIPLESPPAPRAPKKKKVATALRPPLPAEMEFAAAPAIPEPEPVPEYTAAPEEPANPFGIRIDEIAPAAPAPLRVNRVELADAAAPQKYDIYFGQKKPNPFVKTLKDVSPKPAAAPARTNPAAEKQVSMAPQSLKQELNRAYVSENRYLSPMEEPTPSASAAPRPNIRELSPGPMRIGNREVLQMKLEFTKDSSAMTSESVNIVRSFAQVATADHTNAIEIAISDSVMADEAAKRLAARRLAIVSNILRSSGLAERQIVPVLAARDPDSFAFSVVNTDRFERFSTGSVDAFGESENVQTFELMKW